MLGPVTPATGDCIWARHDHSTRDGNRCAACRRGHLIVEIIMKRILLAALTATIATTAWAGGDFQVGGSGPLLVKSVMMGIKSSNAGNCPANAQMKAWIYTTKAGKISYMTIRHGQGASSVKTVMAKKMGGKYVAEISKNMMINQPINAKYRIAAKGQGDFKFSNWVPLKACGA